MRVGDVALGYVGLIRLFLFFNFALAHHAYYAEDDDCEDGSIHDEDAGHGYGIALLYAVGVKLHVDGVLTCRYVDSAEHVVDAVNICRGAINCGFPTIGVVYL